MAKGKVCNSILLACFCVASVSVAHASQANENTQVCERAAYVASQATGVPFDVLRAISLTETGRRRNGQFRTWPWTVNMEGAGRWFDSRSDALNYVSRHHAQGARSFDVGCFQINYRWHGHAFASIDQMFDPEANALYAAGFLAELFQEFGDWTIAAGAYHSRTQKYAKRYRARFAELRRTLEPHAILERAPEAPLSETARENTFPLLVTSDRIAPMASLVPQQERPGRRLIEVAVRP